MGGEVTARLYIDGARTEGEGGATTEVLNPATEEVIGVVPVGTPRGRGAGDRGGAAGLR